MRKRAIDECWAAMRGLRLLVAALTQSARSVEQRTGITNAQLFLLRALADAGPLTINQLAARAHTGQNTVSSVVTKLEQRALVTRGRSEPDRRVVTVTITARGHRVARRAPESPTERMLDALCDLTPSELRTVTRAVDILNARLGIPVEAISGMLFEPGHGTSRGRTRRPPAARAPR